jgi:dienelactone hydrolase
MQELVDPDRPAHLLDDSRGRRLLVQLWYPAIPATASATELLWAGLRRDARTPLWVRTLLAVSRRRTSTHASAPFDADAATAALAVYHHGLISFAAENTSLMEELASRGHIVISIQHQAQWIELQALRRTESAEDRRSAAAMTARLQRAGKAEKSSLARRYYEAAANTNRIVRERATDTVFVLDRVQAVVSDIPACRANRSTTAPVHLIGFSVGGAVATEVAGRDARAGSVVNLDGGLYGSIDARTLALPYLMMYSAPNDGINDALLPVHAERQSAAGTAHLNYHDLAGLLPALRLTGAIGRTDPVSFLRLRNETVGRFCTP